MLLDSNPHLLNAKAEEYPLGYRGIMNNFIQINLKRTFYEDLRSLSKRSLNIHSVLGQF